MLALKRRAPGGGLRRGRLAAHRCGVNRARRFSRARLSGASCEEAGRVGGGGRAARAARTAMLRSAGGRRERLVDCDGEPCDAADLVDERDLVPPAMLPPTGFAVWTLPPAPAPPPPPGAPPGRPGLSPRAPVRPRRPRSRSRSRERRARERRPRRRRSRSRSRERRRDAAAGPARRLLPPALSRATLAS